MEDKNPSREGQLNRNVLGVAVMTALALGWSSAAQSRTQNDPDCFDSTMEAPAETLNISQVDHMPIPSASPVSATDADPAEKEDVSAPLLDLTPRAESTLRDVFDTIDYAESADAVVEATLSPIADTEDLPDISELPDNISPVAPVDTDIELPLLQRQMFRTDI